MIDFMRKNISLEKKGVIPRASFQGGSRLLYPFGDSKVLEGAGFFTRKRMANKHQMQEREERAGRGTIYINSSHNNTIYTLANSKGKVRSWTSSGASGFKNTRKSTSYASQAAAEKLAAVARRCGFRLIHIKMRGLGPGKQSGVRTLHQCGLKVIKIEECTTLPHNGCRPPKSRRI